MLLQRIHMFWIFVHFHKDCIANLRSLGGHACIPFSGTVGLSAGDTSRVRQSLDTLSAAVSIEARSSIGDA
jgi:hypothetical protein